MYLPALLGFLGIDRMIRILAFFLFSPDVEYGNLVGGIERRFLEISSRLAPLGAEIFVLEYKPSISKSWGYSGFRSIALNRRFRGHAFLDIIRVIIHGLKTCLETRCDVIYAPGWFGMGGRAYTIPPYVVSLLSRKPLIIVFHHRPRSFTRKDLVTSLALIRAKTCIAVSRAAANDVLGNLKIKRVVVTGNGVNLGVFRNDEDHSRIYDAIYFGRVSEEKGIRTLLQAWKIVVGRLPSARLILAGGCYEKKLMYGYERLVEESGLCQNVTFAGFVSDEQAVSMLNSSRIFVLPSVEEGFGLAVVEAMAVGLPCILSDIPALKENFGSAAVFVKPQDAEGLAQAVLALLSDSKKRRELQKRGKRLAERFSWEAVARKELEVIRSVCA